MEQSKNYGHSFTQLPDIPYVASGTWGIYGACMVIIDANTVMHIGGQFNGGL